MRSGTEGARYRSWADLAQAFAGPTSHHADTLASIDFLEDEVSGGDDAVLIMGADEALAALMMLCGVDVGSRYFAKASRLMSMVGAELGDDVEQEADPADLVFLDLLGIAEACGASVRLHGYSVAARCEALVRGRLDDNQRALAALLALAAERPADARTALTGTLRVMRQGAAADAVLSWTAQLLLLLEHRVEGETIEHHWQQLLAAFPRWLGEGKAQFRHVFAAARVVLSLALATPRGNVGAALRAQVKTLVASSSQ